MALEVIKYKQSGFWLTAEDGQVVHTDIAVRLRNPQFYPWLHPAREIDWTRGFIPGEAIPGIVDLATLRHGRLSQSMLGPGIERNNYELFLAGVISQVSKGKKGQLSASWKGRSFDFGSFRGDIFQLCADLGCLAYVVGEVTGVERFFNIERWTWLMPNEPQFTHDVVKLLSLFIGNKRIVQLTNYLDQTTAAARILRSSISSLQQNYDSRFSEV